jgi:predicted membrane protein DUF2231
MQNIATRNPVSTANLFGHPLHPLFITLPIGFFIATFLFDLVYWQTDQDAFARCLILVWARKGASSPDRTRGVVLRTGTRYRTRIILRDWMTQLNDLRHA